MEQSEWCLCNHSFRQHKLAYLVQGCCLLLEYVWLLVRVRKTRSARPGGFRSGMATPDNPLPTLCGKARHQPSLCHPLSNVSYHAVYSNIRFLLFFHSTTVHFISDKYHHMFQYLCCLGVIQHCRFFRLVKVSIF